MSNLKWFGLPHKGSRKISSGWSKVWFDPSATVEQLKRSPTLVNWDMTYFVLLNEDLEEVRSMQ